MHPRCRGLPVVAGCGTLLFYMDEVPHVTAVRKNSLSEASVTCDGFSIHSQKSSFSCCPQKFPPGGFLATFWGRAVAQINDINGRGKGKLCLRLAISPTLALILLCSIA